jgi:hypothetical protein
VIIIKTLLVILFLAIFLIVTTTIQINVKNIRYSTEKVNGRRLNKDYKITIKLRILEIFTYFKIDITKTKLERKELQKNINKLENKFIKNRKNFDIKSLKSIKYLRLKIKNLNFVMNIGTEDSAITSISFGIISGIVALILKDYMQEKNENYWKIVPIYQDKNLLLINFDGIFSFKLIHIIYMIYVFKKKGDKYGASNRRINAYSNE